MFVNSVRNSVWDNLRQRDLSPAKDGPEGGGCILRRQQFRNEDFRESLTSGQSSGYRSQGATEQIRTRPGP